MPLSTSRVPGDTITAADVNGIATQVNTNETGVAAGVAALTAHEAAADPHAGYLTEASATGTYASLLARVSVAAIAVPNATVTTVTFTTEVSDLGGLADIGAQPQRLTAPDQRYYVVAARVRWDSNSTGQRYMSVTSNNGGVLIEDRRVPLNQSDVTSSSGPWLLSAADYVVCNLFQTSGGSLNANVEFTMHSVRKP